MTERNLHGAYHRFKPTGNDSIDAVLEAVAQLGSGDGRDFAFVQRLGRVQEAADAAAAKVYVEPKKEAEPFVVLPGLPSTAAAQMSREVQEGKTGGLVDDMMAQLKASGVSRGRAVEVFGAAIVAAWGKR